MSNFSSTEYQKNISYFSSLLKLRSADSHKGQFGHLVCYGGSKGMSGAIALCAKAGLRTGCGLITIRTKKKLIPLIAPYVPEAIFNCSLQRRVDAYVIGPGTIKRPPLSMLLKIPLNCPVVLDAGGIQILKHKNNNPHNRMIITPHPGEISKLNNQPIPKIKKERLSAAIKTAKEFGVIVVLKGHHTVVAKPNGEYFINTSGNSGMATAGSGDVLAGIIGSLLAQQYNLYDAACFGAWLHGYASDLIAKKISEESLIASDIVEEIPIAIKSLCNEKIN